MSSDESPYQRCDDVGPTCPIEMTLYQDYLSLPANAFFAVTFLLCFFSVIYFGLRGRMWSFTIWLGIGVGFEVMGYVARINEHYNPFSMNSFIVEYLTLLLAPTLVAAAISITFKHLVLYYGPKWSVFRPALYPWVFVGTDFFSIFVQVVGGGAVAAATTGGANNPTVADVGEGLVIAGVAFQVVNMVVCSALMLIYVKRRRTALQSGYRQTSDECVLHDGASQGGHQMGTYQPQTAGYDGGIQAESQPPAPVAGQFEKGSIYAKEAKRAKWFVWALCVSYPAIIIRCCYRLAENVQEIRLDVLRNQPLFHIFDSTMMLISVGLLALLPPHIFFPALKPRNGRGQYQVY